MLPESTHCWEKISSYYNYNNIVVVLMIRSITLIFFWYHKGFRTAHKQRGFYPRWLLTRIEKVLKQTIEVVINQNTFLHLQVFKASKGHYISRGCEKILEILETRGVYFRGRFWKILRGGGPWGKSLPWGWFGYFLEPHIINQIYFKKRWKGDLYLCIFFVYW